MQGRIIDLSESADALFPRNWTPVPKEKRLGANREMMKGDEGSKDTSSNSI